MSLAFRVEGAGHRVRRSSVEATQVQMEGFLRPLPYKCHLDEVASAEDWLKICPRLDSMVIQGSGCRAPRPEKQPPTCRCPSRAPQKPAPQVMSPSISTATPNNVDMTCTLSQGQNLALTVLHVPRSDITLGVKPPHAPMPGPISARAHRSAIAQHAGAPGNTHRLRPYPEYSRADSCSWSRFPARRARPGPGPHIER